MKDQKLRSNVFLLGALALCLPSLAAYQLRPDLLYTLTLQALGFCWALFCGLPAVLFWHVSRTDDSGCRAPRWMADGVGLAAALLALLCAWLSYRLHRGLAFIPLPLLGVAIAGWYFALHNGEAHQRFTRWLLKTRRPGELDPLVLNPGPAQAEVRRKDLPREIPAGGALVEEGSFAVDAAHALEKLTQFRLADPDAVLLPLLRCAVASGAEHIAVARTPEGLRMVFDGEPLPPGSLQDPTACLFQEDSPGRERSLDLAYGLLGLLRHKPKLVRVVSGFEPARSVLRMGPLKGIDQVLPPERKKTVIEVVLRGWLRQWRARKFLLCLLPLFPSRPVKLTVDGQPLPGLEPDSGAKTEEQAGLRIALRWVRPGEAEARVNRTRLYKHGVFVCELREPGKTPVYEVFVNDDRFALDLSGAHVVQDDRYLWTMERVEALRKRK